MLASLAGHGTYNRVLKLRSPFGGGKSHTLVSLLHAARSRKSLNQIADCRGLADPGKVDVAVFDGEKFTATGNKDICCNARRLRWGQPVQVTKERSTLFDLFLAMRMRGSVRQLSRR